MATRLDSMLQEIYRLHGSERLLNDINFFNSCLAERYTPEYKEECQLLSKAMKNGAGYLMHDMLTKTGGNLGQAEIDQLLHFLESQVGLDGTQAQRMADYLLEMAGLPARFNVPRPAPVQAVAPVQQPVAPVAPVAPAQNAAGFGAGNVKSAVNNAVQTAKTAVNSTVNNAKNSFAANHANNAASKPKSGKGLGRFLKILGVVLFLLGVIGLILMAQTGMSYGTIDFVGSFVDSVGIGNIGLSFGEIVALFLARNFGTLLFLGVASFGLGVYLDKKNAANK